MLSQVPVGAEVVTVPLVINPGIVQLLTKSHPEIIPPLISALTLPFVV